MSGVVQIPWYATLFRGDKFALAVQEIAPVALRYGASEYAVYRSREDAYRITQTANFDDHADFERYWYGEDFSIWRADYSGWYQVPVVYTWSDLIQRGAIGEPNGFSPAPAAPS